MRGGTSRGPYFRAEDLPSDRQELAETLIAVIGAGHPLNIDGIGGGAAVTTKVAILSRSKADDADIDYFFAQVGVTEKRVDFAPTCGNILSGVAGAAIELGLIGGQDGETAVRIHSVNTGALVEARIRTPAGVPDYEGSETLDGVPGSAAPVLLNFSNIEGSKTSGLFPTGNRIDNINGLDVTLIDAAMPMMIMRTADVGLPDTPTIEQLADPALFERLEPIRIEAGLRMGLGSTADDIRNSVVPKPGFVAPHPDLLTINARYMMPQGPKWDPHPSFAVTGSICVSACVLCAGTVADGMLRAASPPQATITIAHPTGGIRCVVEYEREDGFAIRKAGLLRTAKKIAEGKVFVPASTAEKVN